MYSKSVPVSGVVESIYRCTHLFFSGHCYTHFLIPTDTYHSVVEVHAVSINRVDGTDRNISLENVDKLFLHILGAAMYTWQ